MIIVGSLILENDSVDKKEILEDLLEACNNIKHPIRGLFLRYFLVKILNNYFTDIDLLMINFKEMNKLWIKIKKIKNSIDKFEKIKFTELVLIITLPFTPSCLVNILAGLTKVAKEKFLIPYKDDTIIPDDYPKDIIWIKNANKIKRGAGFLAYSSSVSASISFISN